jgi:hypothetical protein
VIRQANYMYIGIFNYHMIIQLPRTRFRIN